MTSPILLGNVSGGILSDIIVYVRRLIKTSSDQSLTDALISDYINRFYVYDLPARIQLFELKRQYTFEALPNTHIYQFPFKIYQLIENPVYCDGVQIGMYLNDQQFYNVYPEFVQNQQPLMGNGTTGPYTINLGQVPILKAFIDDLWNLLPYVFIVATDAAFGTTYVVDCGYFDNLGLGILIETDSEFNLVGNPPIAGSASGSSGCGTVNYSTGAITYTYTYYSAGIPGTNIINVQTSPYSAGTPKISLFFNNTIKLYPVPDKPYKIQFDCYITPAQFLSTSASVPFAYMSEYLSRGAARKILSDNGDYDQFQFYEPLFHEQEILVLRRTERVNGSAQTPTIFSSQTSMQQSFYTQY